MTGHFMKNNSDGPSERLDREASSEEFSNSRPLYASTSENTQSQSSPVSRSKAYLKVFFLLPALCFVFVLGYFSAKLLAPASSVKKTTENQSTESKKLWTCSMHPQIKLPTKGKCPICFMDLIALEEGRSGGQEAVMEMSKEAIKLAEIQTSRVERRFGEAELRFVGKVDYDETRMKTITAWMPGRLDRLYVDYTGVAVKKGDHLVYLYSPDLISAQEELIQAMRAVRELADSSNSLIKSTADDTVKAAREKLRLLGVTVEQITKLEKTEKVEDHLTIYAPVGGIVVHKNAMEGMYVKTGSPIYRIADLRFVWVYLEAYESDLTWLRYGQTVDLETEAYPGSPFTGRISFIDPILNTTTRTVRVRVNVPNTDGRLKPGMFVRAKVKARIARGGKILESELAGKWISPMHPEVVKDEPGDCDVCGMPLVKSTSLGFERLEEEAPKPLIIPKSSVLLTGNRAVVYVKNSGMKKTKFEGRVITLGPRAGEFYIVKDGLKEGDEIVTHGAFKIDSALQIQAKPSMMSEPKKDEDHSGHNHKKKEDEPRSIDIGQNNQSKIREGLKPIVKLYLAAQVALADDKVSSLVETAKQLEQELANLETVSPKTNKEWQKWSDEVTQNTKSLGKAKTLENARIALSSLSQSLIVALRSMGSPVNLDEVNCPMAFGGLGATWLQEKGDIANPYFGASMLRCGEVVKSFEAVQTKPPAKETNPNKKQAAAVNPKELVKLYISLQESLAADDKSKSNEHIKRFSTLIGNKSENLTFEGLKKALQGLAKAKNIKEQRTAFLPFTKALQPIAEKSPPFDLIRAHCPMALDGKGGDWFQRPGPLANPYFGASMLRCGDIVSRLKGASK